MSMRKRAYRKIILHILHAKILPLAPIFSFHREYPGSSKSHNHPSPLVSHCSPMPFLNLIYFYEMALLIIDNYASQ